MTGQRTNSEQRHTGMKNVTLAAILLVLATAFTACKKDSPEQDYNHWPVIEINGVQQAAVADTVSLLVSWPYSSGCDVMDKFLTKKEGTLHTITALGYTEDAICTQDAGIKTKEYLFVATSPGNYTLDFVNPDGSVITHPILVQ